MTDQSDETQKHINTQKLKHKFNNLIKQLRNTRQHNDSHKCANSASREGLIRGPLGCSCCYW